MKHEFEKSQNTNPKTQKNPKTQNLKLKLFVIYVSHIYGLIVLNNIMSTLQLNFFSFAKRE